MFRKSKDLQVGKYYRLTNEYSVIYITEKVEEQSFGFVVSKLIDAYAEIKGYVSINDIPDDDFLQNDIFYEEISKEEFLEELELVNKEFNKLYNNLKK